MLEVVGQRGLARLLEDRALSLGRQGVLDELLLDRRSALDGALVRIVLEERRAIPANVDPIVFISACPRPRSRRP